MNRPAPRTLTEHAQRAALADGHPTTATQLTRIEELLKTMHIELAAVQGRANLQAGRIGSLSGASEVRVQTSSQQGSPQEGAVDWLSSAPTILRQALKELRSTLSELMA